MLNEDQFGGISKREQAEITGRALGGHIWDSMENLFGGPGAVRQGVVTSAWSDAHKDWQGQDVRANENDDDYPVFHHREGNWEGRYPLGGPYVDIHRHGSESGAVEALHLQDEERNPDGVKNRIRSWVAEDSQYY